MAIITFAGVLGFGSVTALAGGDMAELLKDPEYRQDFEKQKEKDIQEFEEQIEKKLAKKDSKWGATEVGPDAAAIVQTELVPVSEADYSDVDEATAKELKELAKGMFNLKIYLDNGEIHQVGPFKKMPKRVELVDTSVGGVSGKAVIVEE